MGALVADVVPDSPADKAGIKRGDVIIGYEGKPVKDMHALPRLVAETKVGNEVSLEVVRDGKKRPLQVTIGELKAEAQAEPKATQESEVKLGMGLQELTPDLAKQMGMAGKKGPDRHLGGPWRPSGRSRPDARRRDPGSGPKAGDPGEPVQGHGHQAQIR